MLHDAIATYLNDHLAGSVVALELLDDLVANPAGSADVATLAGLRTDITADRAVLETLLAQLGICASAPRQVTAWLTEKLSALKLRLDDPGHGALQRSEALEAIALGILGKRALWQAFATLAEDEPDLRRLDYDWLVQRATDQHTVVETLRLEATKEALGFQAGH
jgi:hypothetical protein